MSTLAEPIQDEAQPQDANLIREMRQIVAPLYERSEFAYWRDFLSSVTLGYFCSIYYFLHPFGTWDTILAFLVASFSLYRVSMFIHEIVHFRKGEMKAFNFGWNLIAGIPMLIPSHFYESHRSHHNTHDFGTHDDAEYLPLVHSGWRGMAKFALEIVQLPIMFVIRFMIGTPISFLIPSTREWMLRRFSSFAMNLDYEHELRKDAPRKLWALIEWGCFLRIMVFITLIYFGAPWTRIPKLLALSFFTMTINHIRTLTAHRYLNEGQRLSHREQFMDSTNITGGWLTELICPLGSRYHAVHHLFPRMPYHNLGKAHRLLLEKLPPESEYHKVTYPTVRSAMADLFRNIRDERKRRNSKRPVVRYWGKSAGDMGA